MSRRPARFTQADIEPDTPLRLADAVAARFPMGGMTVTGLRRERDRGRLLVYRIAGREFTTLADLDRMMELCRDPAKALASTSENAQAAIPSGLSLTAKRKSSLREAQALAKKLKKGSANTSRESTGPSATVIPIVSRSPTS
jgi:hypothetical protein